MQETMTQAEKLAEVLQKLKPDVTKEDRSLAEKKFDVSNATITRYLNGEVLNNDLAAGMIMFYKTRIAKRNEALH